ncbi:MAG: GvpL/GvpF family gas vesicle protein [Bacillota bacterium]
MSTFYNKDEPIYVYALVPTKEKEKFPVLKDLGIDEKHSILLKEFDQITAVVCNLNENDFSKDSIEQQAHDPSWIKVKATHHHDVISSLHNRCTVLPLKFCTIYSNEKSLKDDLNQKQENICRLHSHFKNRDGWNVKIYCDKEKVTNYVDENNTLIKEAKQKIGNMSPGKQFLMKKRFDLQLTQSVNEEIETLTNKLHEKLVNSSDQYTPKKIWSKQVTGKKEDMVWNGVYLINGDAIEKFKLDVLQIQKEYEELGFLLECTGPWPPYDFLEVKL